MKILFTAIWTFIVLYSIELFGISKNIYNLSIALLIVFGGMFLIFKLFKDRKDKKSR